MDIGNGLDSIKSWEEKSLASQLYAVMIKSIHSSNHHIDSLAWQRIFEVSFKTNRQACSGLIEIQLQLKENGQGVQCTDS